MTEVLFNGPEGKLQGYYKHVENSTNAALILHPRDCLDNTMNNNVVSIIFDSFRDQNFSTLKFNFRGIEKSQGSMDDGTGELDDAASALDWLQSQNPDVNHCWVGGVSFGAWVSSQLLMRRPEIIGFINVAIPVHEFDFSFLSPCLASGLIIQPYKVANFEKKKMTALVKKLAAQKNIKIFYKPVNADLSFKNKEKEVKKEIENSIAKIIFNFKN